MKAAFFSIFALATAAIASPVPQAQVNAAPSKTEVQSSVLNLDKLLGGILGGGAIVPGATKGVKSVIKRDVSDITGLLSILKSGSDGIKDKTSGFQGIADKVSAGDLTKAEGAELAIPGLEGLNAELTHIVTELTGSAGLPVADGDVTKVLNLVTVLVNVVLTAVKTIVTVTGLQPQLVSVLHSVFQILAKVLALVLGLVSGLLPGLIVALTPLLAGLGTGVLAPLLTPVVALLAGLGAGI
ncbi:uncharacterized protein FIESC28_02965 [Fusarium coffeatum]|uniref:Uncharacterized protein n=1 Tax=Fusarium coffeatum TaxID=231269 RepID=A0A366S5E8_9HYPO|nr:uncharacterized protein FIESC28_02965 [Fusarium coffeatum]RBR24232.1 hypothetical protein FIESC28_02965 [Fusarium coffeatum]